jgi:hypothetical protein
MTRTGGFPDIGAIEDYSAAKGFGHMRSMLDHEIYFFHITQVLDVILRRKMESGQDCYLGRPLSYIIRNTKKGYAACSLKDPDAIENYGGLIERTKRELLRPSRGHGSEEWKVLLGLQIPSSTDEDLRELLCSPFSENCLKYLSEFPPELRLGQRIPELAAQLGLEGRWLNIETTIPEWLPPLTSFVYGNHELSRLRNLRAALEKERVTVLEANKQARRELLCGNPVGIRFHFPRCLCGSFDIEPLEPAHPSLGPNWKCLKCKREWYFDHCWECHDPVDSRDPKTPPCPGCKWLICAVCDACTDARRDCRRPHLRNVSAGADGKPAPDATATLLPS